MTTLRLVGCAFVTLAVLLCLMQMGGCTFVTNFQEYRISKTADDAPDGIRIHMSFSATRSTSMRVPGLYDLERYREPYKVYFTVWGAFDEITSIDASMVINDDTPIVIPLDIAAFNRNRKLSHDNAPHFPAGEIPFVLKAQDIKTIAVTTSFKAAVDGEEKTFTITNKYEMTTHEQTGNRWWLAIMGI